MRKLLSIFAASAVAFLLTLLLLQSSRSAQALAWTAKVDPWVLETAKNGAQTEVLIYLAEQADLSPANALRGKTAKGRFVYERLTDVARRTQPAVIGALRSSGAEHKAFWIANMIWARGDIRLVEKMAKRADVSHVYANPAVALQLPPQIDLAKAFQDSSSVEWNITLVGAPELWAAGFSGEGIVIGGQDTGYEWTHPALMNQYRGWNGVNATHDYNWHDAIHTSGSSCPADSPAPCDDDGHGTHTMGTMVGDDGGNNQIGMAPGAKWIACRNMKAGWGTPATYAECYQWFIAPTDLNDQNPDPAKAPHIINNSWACPPSEGCVLSDPNVLLTVVQNVRAAGILTVHSAGNEGSNGPNGCGTVLYPAAIYDQSFSVGATDANDTIAGFSSRGPVTETVSTTNRLKPDISAPGVNVRSSVLGGNYSYKLGTSMAAPHVAGLAALLLSAEPALSGQVDKLEELIERTAVPLTTSQGCGGDGPTDVPNNVYGYGRINALAALQGMQHSLELDKTAPTSVLRGETLAYTLTVTHNHILSETRNVIVTDAIPAETKFVSATEPFVQSGSVITWHIGNIGAGSSWHGSLTVQVPLTSSSFVLNNAYSAWSDEVTIPVLGPEVTTLARSPFYNLLPVVFVGP